MRTNTMYVASYIFCRKPVGQFSRFGLDSSYKFCILLVCDPGQGICYVRTLLSHKYFITYNNTIYVH